MKNNDLEVEEYAEISNKVRSGEYFREVRRMVDIELHQPMTDRYLYIMLTIPCVLIVITAFMALNALLPLSTRIPFAYGIKDLLNDYPYIESH